MKRHNNVQTSCVSKESPKHIAFQCIPSNLSQGLCKFSVSDIYAWDDGEKLDNGKKSSFLCMMSTSKKSIYKKIDKKIESKSIWSIEMEGV